MMQSTHKALFWIFQHIICPHPNKYMEWVNDEWESWEVCTLCSYDNLYSRLKAKLMPYKGLLDYRVWLIKSKLGMIKKQNVPF